MHNAQNSNKRFLCFVHRNRCGSSWIRHCICVPGRAIAIRQGSFGHRERMYSTHTKKHTSQMIVTSVTFSAQCSLSLIPLFQILFICGLACVIGLERTFRFFFKRNKIKASLAFFGGIIIVLVGWPIIGMIVESYGFFLLFRYVHLWSMDIGVKSKTWSILFFVFHSSGFFPVAVNFLRRVPILGRFLELPGIRGVSAFAKYFAPPPSSERFFFALFVLFCLLTGCW